MTTKLHNYNTYAGGLSQSHAFPGWQFSLWGPLWAQVSWFCKFPCGVPDLSSFFNPFSNSSTGNPVRSPMVSFSISFCICQAVAEPLRHQLYQAPVREHFLTSAIVSGFVG